MAAPSPLLRQLVADLGPIRGHLGHPVRGPRSHLSLAIPTLDAFLDGGLPRGAITEIFGQVSSGRTTFAHLLTAAATRGGEYVVWIDLPNALDPEGAHEAGANLEQVLWLNPRDRISALRAVDQVLAAGGFHLVILDLDGPPTSRAVLPPSVWLRMARAAVHRDAAIVVLGATSLAGSFATLSLEICASRRIFLGKGGPCPVFEGATSALHLRRHKYGPPSAVAVDLFASTFG
ncbi:MAG: hypothetical protein ABIR79_13515 [Candidatus Binatia bacterium]